MASHVSQTQYKVPGIVPHVTGTTCWVPFGYKILNFSIPTPNFKLQTSNFEL
ncbi:MAG: hypothetical protein JJE25_14930 [Bacteroidia bacterium]|nr:hypothetical protein [Bacteroidia bacterium]